jgi:hypothetical protein
MKAANTTSKKTRYVLPPTAEGRTATQQLPSYCRSRSRPSRRHQSRASSTQQNQEARAVDVVEALRSVLKRTRRALLALGLEGALGARGSQSRRFYRARKFFFGRGCCYKPSSAAHPPPKKRTCLSQAPAKRGVCPSLPAALLPVDATHVAAVPGTPATAVEPPTAAASPTGV